MTRRPADLSPTPGPHSAGTAGRTDLDQISAELAELADAVAASLDLTTRLDSLEHDLAAAQARVETLTTLAALGQPDHPDAGGARGYQHHTLQAWVDDIYSRLAARHQARWCPRWDQHLEAVGRLQLLWHTWESAHTEPANWAARDEWTRLIFDHHTGWLLDREGPFAGCTPHRCALAPRLTKPSTQTGQHPSPVASMDAHRPRNAVAGAHR